MGFGLLFVGYDTVALPRHVFGCGMYFGRLLVLTRCALVKLRGYEKPFRICAYLSVPGIAVSAIKAAHRLWGYLSSISTMADHQIS